MKCKNPALENVKRESPALENVKRESPALENVKCESPALENVERTIQMNVLVSEGGTNRFMAQDQP